MTDDHAVSDEALAALVGHRFPGGTYRVAHWENWLLTDCTGREPMPDDLVHPIVLFHAPILGAGTSIAELFRLGGASGQSGSVGLVGYDWEYLCRSTTSSSHGSRTDGASGARPSRRRPAFPAPPTATTNPPRPARSCPRGTCRRSTRRA
jgi:hypothetical protein